MRVYLISNGTNYKIGIAKDVKSRLSNLQTGNDVELVLKSTIQTKDKAEALALEKQLHEKYADYHVRGEWFSLQEMPEEFRDNGHMLYVKVPNNAMLYGAGEGKYMMAGNGKEFDGTYTTYELPVSMYWKMI
jgi:hypothetical protein